MVCSFICKSVWHSMYAKFLIYLWWNSVWAYMKYYFYRTKEMSIFWRGEMFPMRTSVRTLMLTEISDRYVCFFCFFFSFPLKSPVIRKSSKHLFSFCAVFFVCFLKGGVLSKQWEWQSGRKVVVTVCSRGFCTCRSSQWWNTPEV